MGNNENKLSEYIDRLNAEKKPEEHEVGVESPELEELMKTVRRVKSLKQPAMPTAGFEKKVARAAVNNTTQKLVPRKSKRTWFTGFAAVAAVIMLMAVSFTLLGRNHIVYAMEQAFREVKTYHGILEITETNAEGKEITQAKREVWADKNGSYYIREIEGSQAGLVTVNNGQKKWQLQPDAKKVSIFAAFPDPYRFTFEIGKEIKDIKNALETKKVGEELVSGRKALVLEVTPKGGAAYKLWIDEETSLPLKKQSAMQNALQYTITYTTVDFEDTIPAELMAYQLPDGYREVTASNEQLVSNLDEARDIAGFEPKTPQNIPAGYAIDSIAVDVEAKLVKLYYANADKQVKVVVLQGKAEGEFKPASSAVLGKIGSHPAEIQSPIEGATGVFAGGSYSGAADLRAIRWQEQGYEYLVIGDAALADLGLFAEGIAQAVVQLPSPTDMPASTPQVEVPVDLAIEENEQKSVDAGHSPWKLDPVFVAQVFVSLQISPEGIIGDYPIKYESLEVEQNTGTEAIIKVHDEKSPIDRVYLKKLVRQDATGIWTVVGYDPSAVK